MNVKPSQGTENRDEFILSRYQKETQSQQATDSLSKEKRLLGSHFKITFNIPFLSVLNNRYRGKVFPTFRGKMHSSNKSIPPQKLPGTKMDSTPHTWLPVTPGAVWEILA